MINKALFIKTGTYNDMSLRPYETNIDNVTLTEVSEIYGGVRGPTKLGAGALTGVASNIIKPSATTMGNVEIPNGWGEERLRFLIDVTIKQPGLPDTRKIVQGYTDHVGVGHNNSIDPNMRLYFNNIATLRETRIKGSHGYRTRVGVTEASQILTGAADSFLDNDNLHISLRPEDVFTAMGAREYQSEGVYDLRNSFATQVIKKSRRSNNIPSQYLSGVIDAYSVNSGVNDDYTSVGYEEAAGYISENTITSDSFFIMLNMNCEAFARTGYITYSELCGIFPDLDARSDFLVKEARDHHNNIKVKSSRGESEEWYGAGIETIWATSLSSTLPSLMMDLMITKFTVLVTNDTLTTKPEFKVFDARSFADGVDLTPYIESLLMRLEVEVFNPLSKNNMFSFDVLCEVDILGDTRLDIMVNGGPSIAYVSPTFCDGLYTPTLTDDSSHINNIAYDLGVVCDLVNDTKLRATDEHSVRDWNESFNANTQY